MTTKQQRINHKASLVKNQSQNKVLNFQIKEKSKLNERKLLNKKELNLRSN